MNNSRIRIDISQGIVEAEGSEDFVRSIYDDFKSQTELVSSKALPQKKQASPKTATKSKPKSKSSKSKASRGSNSIVKDLDLSAGGKTQSLRDFFNTYKTNSNMEKNLIFVYWLQELAKIDQISVDHIFTCYRSISGIKAPAALYQSLIDTSTRKGWLDTSSVESIKVTIPGVNYLEHDLSKVDE